MGVYELHDTVAEKQNRPLIPSSDSSSDLIWFDISLSSNKLKFKTHSQSLYVVVMEETKEKVDLEVWTQRETETETECWAFVFIFYNVWFGREEGRGMNLVGFASQFISPSECAHVGWTCSFTTYWILTRVALNV